jgi:hypothetical protein
MSDPNASRFRHRPIDLGGVLRPSNLHRAVDPVDAHAAIGNEVHRIAPLRYG